MRDNRDVRDYEIIKRGRHERQSLEQYRRKQDDIQVQAIFIGQQGSMGYRRGRTYLLTIRESTIFPDVVPGPGISRGPQPCPYSSLESFFRNWTNVRREA